MKYLLFVFSAFLLINNASGQQTVYSISGKVTDAKTGSPLAFASVAAQNTTIGTLTDSLGNFKMRLPEGGYTLTVSYTGYEPQSIRISGTTAGEPLTVALDAETKSLEEVSIVFDAEVKDGWEKYGQFFIENFIGQSNFSKACIIRNPSSLHFYFYKKRNVLKVIAKDPVIVDNFALGYTLTFSLDSLVNDYNTRTCSYVGYPMFEEMQGTNEQKYTWAKNRNNIYYGSLLHFMRSLYKKTLVQDGYELRLVVKTPTEEIPVPVKDPYGALRYLTDSTGVAEIQPTENEVAVIYHRERPEVAYLMMDPKANKNFQISTLVFDNQPTFIEKNGYYYPQEEIVTNGYLGFKKIGDMLPYNYNPLPITDDDKN